MAMPAHSRTMSPAIAPTPETSSSGGRMVSTDGRALPLRTTTLRASARGGVCRVIVEQRFVNPHAEALHVTYQLPMPSDAAVSGFAFTVAGRRIHGEVDRKARARERFETAILEGRTAALLEQVRSSVFQQDVGNIPPGAELIAEVTVDQRLAWLEGAWEWRFPSVIGARYMGEAGRVDDAAKLQVEVADGPLPGRLHLALTIADEIPEGRVPASTSHALAVRTEGRAQHVSLREDQGVRLDRDVLVRWRVATPDVGITLATARPAATAPRAGQAHGLLTIVPPERSASESIPRDLIVLIDTSGSMGGRPLEQAARVVSAMISTLDERDRIDLVEFASSRRHWQPEPVAATASNRAAAIAWVRSLRAGGGTEMRSALVEALRPLRADSQRQVVLVTDGYIGFEAEIVKEIHERLPAGSRVHTIGVGSAVNRSLTQPAARAGRGLEVVIGLDEDPEPAAMRMVARTDAPVLTEVTVEGSAVRAVAPEKLPDVFAASPVLVGLELRPEGGDLVVRGRTLRGRWERRLRVTPVAPGSGDAGVSALFAREAVEDLETARAAGARSGRIDGEIERLGLEFQIATRMTSWVAVSEAITVDREAPFRAETMPQELPYGVSIEGMGLRAASPVASALFPGTALGAVAESYAMAAAPAPRAFPADDAPAGYPKSLPAAAPETQTRSTGYPAQPSKRSSPVPNKIAFALLALFMLASAIYLLVRAVSTTHAPTPAPRPRAPIVQPAAGAPHG